MNRIRKYNNKFEVLITPHQRFNTSYEYILGNWTDEHIRDYQVIEFDTLGDAQAEAFTHPDIDWSKMVLMHKDPFYNTQQIIKDVLAEKNFIVEFNAKYMSAEQLKDTMFNRIKNNGNRFRLTYNMNDIISYHIINPWTKNCSEIVQVIKENDNLRLFKQFTDQGVHHLVGKTEVGTTYEICIWPSLIYNWAKWLSRYPQTSKIKREETLKQIIKSQNNVDSGIILR